MKRMQMFHTMIILEKKINVYIITARIMHLGMLSVNLIRTCLLSRTIGRVWASYYLSLKLKKKYDSTILAVIIQ